MAKNSFVVRIRDFNKSYEDRKHFGSLHKYPSSFSGVSVFTVVFMVLFIINFFYSATSNESLFSFSSLLQAIQNAPSVPTDWIKTFSDLRITADWTVAFNWLRDFLNNYVMKLITVFLFLCTGIVQLLTYSIYFIGILFGGV